MGWPIFNMEGGLEDGDAEFLCRIQEDLSRPWPGDRSLVIAVGNGHP